MLGKVFVAIGVSSLIHSYEFHTLPLGGSFVTIGGKLLMCDTVVIHLSVF